MLAGAAVQQRRRLGVKRAVRQVKGGRRRCKRAALHGGAEGRFDGIDVIGVVHQLRDIAAREHQQFGSFAHGVTS